MISMYPTIILRSLETLKGDAFVPMATGGPLMDVGMCGFDPQKSTGSHWEVHGSTVQVMKA